MMYLLSQERTFGIHRTVFQTILHQALIHQEYCPCLGILGIQKDTEFLISDAALWQNEANGHQVLQDWKTQDVQCIGLFSLQSYPVPWALRELMPISYLHLVACLDKKGRLDLLARHYTKLEQTETNVTLILTERC